MQMDPKWLEDKRCFWGKTETKDRHPSHSTYMSVFSAETFAILACAKDCIDRNYTDEQIYIFSDRQVALQILEASRITSKLVWGS